MNTNNKIRQQGLSLIELMIAIALGVFISGGVIELFVNSKQTYRVQENLSRLQENARSAMNFIARDLRMADYSGCSRDSINNATNNLDATDSDYDANIHGFSASIDGINGTAGASIALDSPDSITIKSAFDSGITVQAPYGPLTSSNVLISTNSGLKQGDVILIADCSQADIIEIGNADPEGDSFIVHETSDITLDSKNKFPGNYNPAACATAAPAHCLSKIYQGDASIFKLSSNTYTIQNGAGNTSALFKNGDELLEGIENMQILYGEDTDGDNSPNYFVPAGTAGLNMDNVISVRISLLATTLEDNISTQPVPYTIFADTVTPADNRIRRVFTLTIALRNRLP
jgi:type IV pilus assembly protein PilW